MTQAAINVVLRQSLKTFSNKFNTELFTSNLHNLKAVLNTLSADHVNLDPRYKEDVTWSSPGTAPMTYIQIYHDNFINMAIFVLKPGMKIPLHDHPSMHGLLKVISGKVRIRNYSIRSDISDIIAANSDSDSEDDTINPIDIVAEKHADIFADETSECCSLGPKERNIHEIESVDGPSAFLDVLAPPYDVYISELGHRKCSYYCVDEKLGPNLYHLMEIPAPHWFWSDEAPYLGPKLIKDEIEIDSAQSSSEQI